MASDEPTMNDMNNPEFLEWVKSNSGFPVKPNDADFDQSWFDGRDKSDEEASRLYRLAQAEKLMRLCRLWKSKAS